jgi:hypothetical protein
MYYNKTAEKKSDVRHTIIKRRSKMKVIFLDLDGVLNSDRYDRERDWSKTNTYIDETRLPLLKRIVDETGAKIVFSSTWRDHWNADPALCDEDGKYINECFARYGLSIYDKTPEIGSFTERKAEIAQWLQEHKTERYVIIDDFYYGWEEMNPFYVRTDMKVDRGLEERHVLKAIAILNGENRR